MGDERSEEDAALLARLNTLKRSNVSLDSPSNAAARDVTSGTANTPEDLIERFQRLDRRGPVKIEESD